MIYGDEENVDDVPHEPKINILKVGSFWKIIIDRGEESSKNKEGSDSAHETITEVLDVYVEGEEGEAPEEGSAEVGGGELVDVVPFEADGEGEQVF